MFGLSLVGGRFQDAPVAAVSVDDKQPADWRGSHSAITVSSKVDSTPSRSEIVPGDYVCSSDRP
jgi:hypothetical protein